MYREFRELEGKLAAFSEHQGPTNSAEAYPASEANSGGPAERPVAGDAATDSAGAGAVDENMDVLVIKNDRDAKKRDIKQWIKDFEDREGHTPTAKWVDEEHLMELELAILLLRPSVRLARSVARFQSAQLLTISCACLPRFRRLLIYQRKKPDQGPVSRVQRTGPPTSQYFSRWWRGRYGHHRG